MLATDIKNFKDTMDAINTEMVELHCKITRNDLSLDELRTIQEDLNTLAIKYHLLDYSFNSVVDSEKEQLNKQKDKYAKKSKYCTAFALIPGFGIGLAIYFVLKNYNITLEAKYNLNELAKLEDEMDANLSIINRMLSSKFITINNKFAMLTNDKENIIPNYDTTKDIFYYDANELIVNYLNDYTFNVDDVEPGTQKAMIKLLQLDLKTDNNDLFQLLEKAREIEHKKQARLIREHKA